MIDRVIEKCRLLRLKACTENLQSVIEMAAQKNWPTLKVIDHLFALELEARRQSKIALRFKQSIDPDSVFKNVLLKATEITEEELGCTLP